MLIITLKENNSFINNYLMNDKFYKSVMKKIKNTNCIKPDSETP